MTPCEELGYKVGDRFEVLRSDHGFKKSQIVELYRDDKTDAPLFSGENTDYKNCDGKPGAYFDLDDVKKLDDVKELAPQPNIKTLIQKRDKLVEKIKRQSDKLDLLNEEIKQAIAQLEREIERDTGLSCKIYEQGASDARVL